MTVATRRGMLGWLASTPMAAKEAVSSAATFVSAATEAAAVAKTVGLSGIGLSSSSLGGPYLGPLDRPETIALFKSGLAPEWMKREVDNIAADRSRQLDPDVAGLRSMSISARYRLQKRRTVDRMIDEATWSHAIWSQRQKFYDIPQPR